MKTTIGRCAGYAAAYLSALALCAVTATAQKTAANDPPSAADAGGASATAEIRSWPDGSRALARVMIDKYGEPKQVSGDELVWIKNGPWLKTVVYRKSPQSLLGMNRKDVLEQSISYNVPADKTADIKSFNSRLKIDAQNGLLSSRSESEGLNFLALNLADEIATNKRNVDEARDFYRRTEKLSESGKNSAYMSGFLFTPATAASTMKDATPEPNPRTTPPEETYQGGAAPTQGAPSRPDSGTMPPNP
ncbi:MAG: hypothetical protein ACHQ49_07300 [Elusimicrobiota bacterium]